MRILPNDIEYDRSLFEPTDPGSDEEGGLLGDNLNVYEPTMTDLIVLLICYI